MNKQDPKKYKIWSEVLQEQTLCETISNFSGLDSDISKIKREAESYGIQKQDNATKQTNNKNKKKKRLNKKSNKNQTNLEKINKNILNQIKEEYVNKNSNNGRNNVENESHNDTDEHLTVTFDENKDRSHIRAHDFDSDEIVCNEIVRQLDEKKSDLIMRCVKILGKKKSLELLYATQDIEDQGGMLTEDGFRKRTPGGIYIQLIKKDMTILSVQKNSIFIQSVEEKKAHKKRKRLNQKLKFEKMKAKLMKDTKKNEKDNNQKTSVDVDSNKLTNTSNNHVMESQE